MFTKNLLFYFVAGSAIAFVAQAAGANIGIVIFASMVAPPTMLLAIALMRYNRWL